ncbi:MAG TPA: glycerol kinase GlpK [bacterium]|nr:glycerol kinase GlpK [bacterium]HOL54905.1 glycerol kinase GlpK [bacterium]HPO81404.1 glycerol kinase GlpK [bacterium]
MGYILVLDQGTTNSRAIIFDESGNQLGDGKKELPQIFPKPGWVEQNPDDIWSTIQEAIHLAIKKSEIDSREISAIGITNQRETTILWDKITGKPLYNAIVWQCRRSADICEELRDRGLEPLIREKTGLLCDAYFSSTKIMWLLRNIPELKDLIRENRVAFGTVDSWLLWNLTGGKVHATDTTNASRTMLFNITKCDWDDDLLDAFDIPRSILPDVVDSAQVSGYTEDFPGKGIPVSGIVGDQQGALVGQCCFSPGSLKVTYGTGCFLLEPMERFLISEKGMLTTIAWSINRSLVYAIEGSVFTGGSVVQWLRDNLGIIPDSASSEVFARAVDDTGDVYFVPALTGLGAPYWDMYARGMIIGISRSTGREHIVRAALEGIAYQIRDLVNTIEDVTEVKVQELRVDGGATGNSFLLQFQSDLLGIPVIRPRMIETTSLGAFILASIGIGVFKDLEEAGKIWKVDRVFLPERNKDEMDRLYDRWKEAVRRSLGWTKN